MLAIVTEPGIFTGECSTNSVGFVMASLQSVWHTAAYLSFWGLRYLSLHHGHSLERVEVRCMTFRIDRHTMCGFLA